MWADFRLRVCAKLQDYGAAEIIMMCVCVSIYYIDFNYFRALSLGYEELLMRMVMFNASILGIILATLFPLHNVVTKQPTANISLLKKAMTTT